jgi:hypothetical protein
LETSVFILVDQKFTNRQKMVVRLGQAQPEIIVFSVGQALVKASDLLQ